MHGDIQPRPTGGTSKERILWAAIREFETYGFAGARVDRIAAAAGSNKQLVYRHFGNKEKLYDAVFSHLTSELREYWAQARHAGIPYLDRVVPAEGVPPQEDTARATWTRLLTWEGLSPSSRDDSLVNSLRDNYAIQAEDLEADPRAHGALLRFPPRYIVALIIAADHLPFATPDVFAALLGKTTATDQDVVEWFKFVREVVTAIESPADGGRSRA